MQGERPRRLGERTVDYGLAYGGLRPKCHSSQQPAVSGQCRRTDSSFLHWLLPCWLLAAESLRAKRACPADFVHKLKLAQKELKESRVWLLFASRLAPGPEVESLRAESRELLLMIGKSIGTAVARSRGKDIGA